MEVRHRTGRISETPAVVFAAGALVAEIAVLVLPLSDGSSPLSYALGEGFTFRGKVAYLLALFAQTIAIVAGLFLLRRGRANVASGVFLGLLILLGLRVISSVLTSIEGWRWQTSVIVGLQAIECALLFLAARAARQHGTAPSP